MFTFSQEKQIAPTLRICPHSHHSPSVFIVKVTGKEENWQVGAGPGFIG